MTELEQLRAELLELAGKLESQAEGIDGVGAAAALRDVLDFGPATAQTPTAPTRRWYLETITDRRVHRYMGDDLGRALQIAPGFVDASGAMAGRLFTGIEASWLTARQPPEPL